MRIPTEGERLTAANGTVYVVEAVHGPEDDGSFSVEFAFASDADDMEAIGFDLTDAQFEDFCKAEGISLA